MVQGLFCPNTGYKFYKKEREWISNCNSVSINLPLNWCNKKLMGLALGACFDAFYPPVSGFLLINRVRVIVLGDMPHTRES